MNSEAAFESISIDAFTARLDHLVETTNDKKVKIISVNGSVAAGKTTFTEQLKAYFLEKHKSVQVIHTDSFLLSNKELAERNLMDKKGFPVTYQQAKIRSVLKQIAMGDVPIIVPQYSHAAYNIVEEYQFIEAADIYIIEGIGFKSKEYSNWIDLSLFLDAKIENIGKWYRRRFIKNISLAKPDSILKKYEKYPENRLKKVMDHNWNEVNLINYYENILPEKSQSDIILEKNEVHKIVNIYSRKR
ncbi:hypothetical protein RV15_GL002586 [Enterococcus silesiacus]|nr:hypothetical protein RV15_GL002586 [Enterococcus silesiacus]